MLLFIRYHCESFTCISVFNLHNKPRSMRYHQTHIAYKEAKSSEPGVTYNSSIWRPCCFLSLALWCLCPYGELWLLVMLLRTSSIATWDNPCSLLEFQLWPKACLTLNTAFVCCRNPIQPWLAVQTHNDQGIHCHQSVGTKNLCESQLTENSA